MKIANPENMYEQDGNIVYSCLYHVAFCPKFCRDVLVGEIVERLEELIMEKQAEYSYRVLDMEIFPDHVHMLLFVDPRLGVDRAVTKVKNYTARVLREEFPELKGRLPNMWTRNRFISSVGEVTLGSIKQYIRDQKGV